VSGGIFCIYHSSFFIYNVFGKKSKLKGKTNMSNREYIKSQVDTLPESVLDSLAGFIAYQRFALGLYDNDTDYLMSVPGMAEIIKDGLNTPLSECVPLSEVWADA